MKRMSFVLSLIFTFVTASAYAGTIQLPKTGQTTCYDSEGNAISCTGTGQDGELQVGIAWPEPRFTNDNGSTPITGDVVVDQLTGLMWTRDANLLGGHTWYETLDYIADMNAGIYQNHGYTDWRLPNVNELESLKNVETDNCTRWLNDQGFINVQEHWYGSSTTCAWETVSLRRAWSVWIGVGGEGQMAPISRSWQIFSVWPVRAEQCGIDNSAICLPKTGQVTSYFSGDDGDLQMGVPWPAPRFLDNADGTVVDKLTNLMWTKDANLPNEKKTWQGALDYVTAMNNGNGTYGYTNWRLPNIEELRSLNDFSKYTPCLPQGHPFANVLSDVYWSSSSRLGFAWTVGMNAGEVLFAYTTNGNSKYVWPVRAGQCGPLDDWDNDTVCNDVDNCPNDYNPHQGDCDGNGVGDACDNETIDPDDDGIDQACDNCPNNYNPGQEDTDNDNFADACDNCASIANSPNKGSCVKSVSGVLIGTGVPCTDNSTCAPYGVCQMAQEDMNANGIGDVCECYADINHDGKVNTTDLGIMKIEFFRTNCATVPCQADLNEDNKVNTSDLGIMKVQFFKTGCPVP